MVISGSVCKVYRLVLLVKVVYISVQNFDE